MVMEQFSARKYTVNISTWFYQVFRVSHLNKWSKVEWMTRKDLIREYILEVFYFILLICFLNYFILWLFFLLLLFSNMSIFCKHVYGNIPKMYVNITEIPHGCFLFCFSQSRCSCVAMAAWVEATTREMGQSLINPDKPSVSASALPGDTGKPALGPKPHLMPKPFALHRNATVRPVRAPKTNFSRELHRAASSEALLDIKKPGAGDPNPSESLNQAQTAQ